MRNNADGRGASVAGYIESGVYSEHQIIRRWPLRGRADHIGGDVIVEEARLDDVGDDIGAHVVFCNGTIDATETGMGFD